LNRPTEKALYKAIISTKFETLAPRTYKRVFAFIQLWLSSTNHIVSHVPDETAQATEILC
jgi:hypothetical protein